MALCDLICIDFAPCGPTIGSIKYFILFLVFSCTDTGHLGATCTYMYIFVGLQCTCGSLLFFLIHYGNDLSYHYSLQTQNTPSYVTNKKMHQWNFDIKSRYLYLVQAVGNTGLVVKLFPVHVYSVKPHYVEVNGTGDFTLS